MEIDRVVEAACLDGPRDGATAGDGNWYVKSSGVIAELAEHRQPGGAEETHLQQIQQHTLWPATGQPIQRHGEVGHAL